MNAHSLSDQADFRQLQLGEDRALDRLIARWQRPLHAFAWRYLRNDADACDLVEEVFVRLYRERQRLRPDTNLPAWLFTTLTNLCHNRHRWLRRHPMAGIEESDTPPAAGAPDRQLEQDEALQALARAIEHLPHDWKTAVLLHHYEGWSYAQIGAATGCSGRGVETRLYRAREQLRRELATHARDEPPAAITISWPRPG